MGGNGSNEVLQHVVQAFGGPGRTAMGFTPAYSMHPIIAHGRGHALGRRPAPRRLLPRRRRGLRRRARAERPDVVLLCSPNNPTGTALDLDWSSAVYDVADGVVVVDEAYAEFARPGTPSARHAAARARAARRDADDEQGVRAGRRAAGLPGGRRGGLRRDAAGAPAVPPVQRSPRPRPVRRSPTARRCWAPSRRSRSSATGRRASWPRSGCARCRATPTSCCSAASPTRRPCGRGFSTTGCWSATSASPGTCA